MFAMLGTTSLPADRSRRMSAATAAAWLAGYWVSIWPAALSPYIQGEISVTACRLASTAAVPCSKFQYGIDATTSVCRGAPPRSVTIVKPTSTPPISTTASHTAPAKVCRDGLGARAGAWLPRSAVFVESAVPGFDPLLVSTGRHAAAGWA